MKAPNTWTARCTRPRNYYAFADSPASDCNSDYVMYQAAKVAKRYMDNELAQNWSTAVHDDILWLNIDFHKRKSRLVVRIDCQYHIGGIREVTDVVCVYPDDADIYTLMEMGNISKEGINQHLKKLA